MVPSRVELITWFVLRGKLNVKDRLIKLKILGIYDGKCLMCKNIKEFVSYSILYSGVSWKI